MSIDYFTKKYNECKLKREAERWLAIKMMNDNYDFKVMNGDKEYNP